MDPQNPAQLLRAIPWLARVPAARLDALAAQAMLHRVPAGSIIFDQAETPTFATILLRGRVELLAVRGEDETLVELAASPDILLPAAVLNEEPYLLRARVLEEALLLLIGADAFRAAVAADHALCLALLALQAAQFRRQVKHAKNIRLRSAEERVGAYLLQVAAREGRLPLEKRLIASQLGMTRETFSRALAAMLAHGIRLEGEMVVLADAEAARARFPFDPLIDGEERVRPLLQGSDPAARPATRRNTIAPPARRRR